MLKYANSTMAELGLQLALSPRHLRHRQLEGIDRLLDIVEPEKSYPYDLICFHITGTRPLKQNQKPAVGGTQLLADLPTTAEHITRKAALKLVDLEGAYQTHEALATQFGVSTKTIRRWRSRGLMGIRAMCEDGVCRMLFEAGAIKRFRERNEELVKRGASFKLLTDAEKRHIVEQARAMLTEKRRKLHLVARAIAAETGRAVETCRYTLRQYDAAHPDDALFARNGEPMVSQRHLAIWRCRNNGETPEQIATAFGCDPASVRAVLRELQARQLKELTVEYVDNELFGAPNAAELIVDVPRPQAPGKAKPVRVPKDLPAYLRSLYHVPLLSREQEADLFRRFNFLKFRIAKVIEELDVFTVTDDDLEWIDGQLARAEALKNEIIQANLRLVVSIAKRHMGYAENIFEIISDGNMTLMRAVERFDFSMGNKFSTYATWAVMKNYARTVPERHYHLRRYVTGQEEMLDATAEDYAPETSKDDIETVRSALSDGMQQLTERERTIVTHHYGLLGAKGMPVTLEELGKRFGVTKERIRQIEKRAMTKLREVLSPGLLEVFAD